MTEFSFIILIFCLCIYCIFDYFHNCDSDYDIRVFYDKFKYLEKENKKLKKDIKRIKKSISKLEDYYFFDVNEDIIFLHQRLNKIDEVIGND